MRRLALIACALLAGAALLGSGTAGGADDGPYEVRAYFDNAAFLVPGEEVRIAGAAVGTVSSVDVTRPGEVVGGDGREIPGKAAVVLKIDDPAFQDFREDASCLIRPQSLLGEKYVECEPTQPRAPGSEPPPELEEVAEGQPGEGQLFLPLESNGKAVDLDLVNNIMREPYADRFRLIINDLGAGLAARGDELDSIVRRAAPALQETNRVLAILAEQNEELAKLAQDSDAVLEPLARERTSVRGFITEANVAGQAAAERRADITAGLDRLPEALRELRPTMTELARFANNATPVATSLRSEASSINAATRKLGPFSAQAETALISLADEAQDAAPDLVDSDPVIRQIRDLAKKSKGGAKALRKLIGNLRKTGGYDQIAKLILNGSDVLNGFDSYGHYLRAELLVTNCVDYEVTPLSGCSANFGSTTQVSSDAGLERLLELGRNAQEGSPSTSGAPSAPEEESSQPSTPEAVEPPPIPDDIPQPGDSEGEPGAGAQGEEGTAGAASARRGSRGGMRDALALLDFLIGEGR